MYEQRAVMVTIINNINKTSNGHLHVSPQIIENNKFYNILSKYAQFQEFRLQSEIK
jgi:hypothetical protein